MEKNKEYKCPLSAVDRRLGDLHFQWHQAEVSYFDPEDFRLAIQTAIQTLRTVTFILQSNKRLFPDFDNWYEPWREKLRADPLMKWMVEDETALKNKVALSQKALFVLKSLLPILMKVQVLRLKPSCLLTRAKYLKLFQKIRLVIAFVKTVYFVYKGAG